MKGCVVAGAVLVLILVCVILNGVYVRNTAEALLTAVEALPSIPDPANTASAIREIEKLLEKHALILGITIPYSIIDRVSEGLIHLEACVLAGDDQQYAETLALLRDLICELSRSEKLSLKNIL